MSIGDGDNQTIQTLKGEIEDVTRNKMISEHGYGAELIRRNKRITALEDALREAVCPDSCYNGGIYTDLGHGNFETVECEWCKNRTALLGDEK